jgi:hypothetical protein
VARWNGYEKQIEQIANSAHRFGFITPIVVDADNRIRGAFGRADVAEVEITFFVSPWE